MNNGITPLVTVVIPTYNHGRYLGTALQSVVDQTHTNWEAIVIDNYSNDNTDQVMANFSDSRITYLKVSNNGSIAVSRNVGIRAAKGEWIAFLDSDDVWTVNKLQALLDRVNDKVDFIYHGLKIISGRSSILGRKKMNAWQVKKPVLIDLLVRGNAIATSSVLVRKKLLDSISGFNESFTMVASEDYNAWLRVAQLTNNFIYVPFVFGYYRIHNSSSSNKDMSISARSAVSDFLQYLNKHQQNMVEANCRYASGRFHWSNGDHRLVKDDLWFVVKYGCAKIKVRALLYLFAMVLKK